MPRWIRTARAPVWDPLFYGFYDWSPWYIGEIIGEFVTVNRGLDIQTVRFRAEPTEGLTVNLLYSYYRLGSGAGQARSSRAT